MSSTTKLGAKLHSVALENDNNDAVLDATRHHLAEHWADADYVDAGRVSRAHPWRHCRDLRREIVVRCSLAFITCCIAQRVRIALPMFHKITTSRAATAF